MRKVQRWEPFGAELDVLLGGRGELGEEKNGDEEREQEDRGGGKGHPELRYPLVVHEPRAHALYFSAGEDVRAGKSGEEEFGGMAALEEAHHQSPHHAERDAVQKDGEHLEGGGQDGEEQ